MSQDYPVTRLQAARELRKGERLEVDIEKTERALQVMVRFAFLDKKINCRIWSGPGVWWTHLSWKQLLGFIRRNYRRNYTSLID